MSATNPPRETFVTADLPGIGGAIRVRPEHFRVEEIPLRQPDGGRGYVRAFIEKRRMSTPELVGELATRLRSPPRSIGVAGNKDSDAVTRQWVSLPADCGRRIGNLRDDRFRVLRVENDSEPLRTGDLAGNRFDIEIHELADSASARVRAREILAVLSRRGVPNYFGPQRFGTRGNAATIGALFIRGEYEAAIAELLGGSPAVERDPAARRFREACARGDLAAAGRRAPRGLRLEATLVDALLSHAPLPAVVKRIPERDRRIFLSAWQSRIFNGILAARIDTLDRALDGDLLLDHRGASIAACRDPAIEQPAVERFEKSPTGWMPGERVGPARGRPGEIETAVFATDPVPLERLVRPLGLTLPGERRALRVQVQDCATTAVGASALLLQFRLPRGSFATALLDEVMKPGADGR